MSEFDMGLALKIAALTEDRDRWKRLFNRMDGAISHHRKKVFVDDEDEALHAAHDRVLKAACKPANSVSA